ncbi:ABC transporter substrate-binding protein [Kineosporia babensis]|uniref:ABC transporter substrate-binding protein n=1 Tax=Kineosporia babensis TaxID=499548 RepID=A0A9X1NIE3_9ACTN|nr:ABC transporter substrate-binding protein [Kineosporia babensis]
MNLPVRTTLAGALVGVLTLLSACASSSSPSAAPPSESVAGTYDESIAALVPAEIAESGKITVAAGPGYPPFYLLADDQKTLAGADIEQVRAIGDVLGLEISFQDIKFDAMIPALQTNRVNMAAGGFSITPERLKAVDFVSNFSGGTSLIVPVGNPLELSLDTMCGRKIAVQKGTVYADNYMPVFTEKCTAAGQDAIDVSVYPTAADAALALTSGRADATMSDYGPLAYQAERSNGQFEVLEANYDPSTWGFAFPQGSGLEEAVAAAMNRMIEDGTYAEILARWEVQAGAITTSEIHTDETD